MLNAYYYCVISYNYKTIINECKKTHPCRLDNFCKSVPYFSIILVLCNILMEVCYHLRTQK